MRNERNLTFKIRTFGQGNDLDDRGLMIDESTIHFSGDKRVVRIGRTTDGKCGMKSRTRIDESKTGGAKQKQDICETRAVCVK